jgi:hypothetical protein
MTCQAPATPFEGRGDEKIVAWPSLVDGVICGGSPQNPHAKETSRMRLWLWIAFLLISNLLGIEVLKAAVTLPLDEALVPGVLTLPLIGLTAVSVTRVVDAWKRRDE